MDMKEVLNWIVFNLDLFWDEMKQVMCIVMNGEVIDVQIGVFLMGLCLKSEIIDEIIGVIEVMCELVIFVIVNVEFLIDIVGIGGDGFNLFNVFLVLVFVVVVVGGYVVKYGNCGVLFKSGSVDLIEKVGINLDMKLEQVVCCIEQIGVGFMFVLVYYGVMKYVIGLCKELGCCIIFNIFGFMINLVGVKCQLLGVFIWELCCFMVEVLQCLGFEYIMVVCFKDGLDEISLVGLIYVVELKNGEIIEYDIILEDLGIKSQFLVGLIVDSFEDLLKLICVVFGCGYDEMVEKVWDLIVLNVGVVIYVVGLVIILKGGVDLVLDVIGFGLVVGKMFELVDFF